MARSHFVRGINEWAAIHPNRRIVRKYIFINSCIAQPINWSPTRPSFGLSTAGHALHPLDRTWFSTEYANELPNMHWMCLFGSIYAPTIFTTSYTHDCYNYSCVKHRFTPFVRQRCSRITNQDWSTTDRGALISSAGAWWWWLRSTVI